MFSCNNKVQDPQSIASTHAQICPRIITYSATYVLKNLATKTLRELACTPCEAPRFLALEPESFSATVSIPYSFVFAAFMRVRSNLPLYLRSTCLCSPSPQIRPRMAVKGISRHNFRPLRTPYILNLAFIVKNTYI